MGWIAILALVGLVLVAVLRALPGPRHGWEALVAALMVGVAGYAVQGHSALEGAPKPATSRASSGAAIVAQRVALGGGALPSDSDLLMADALVRQGDDGDAVAFLGNAVGKPAADNAVRAQAWLAMGNALVDHAEGNLSPAALYAYRHAAAADPKAPGPPMFLGLALARQGKLDEARALWAKTLQQAPANAPWRADLAQKLARLDAVMARMQGGAPAGAAPGSGQ